MFTGKSGDVQIATAGRKRVAMRLDLGLVTSSRGGAIIAAAFQGGALREALFPRVSTGAVQRSSMAQNAISKKRKVLHSALSALIYKIKCLVGSAW